PAPASGNDAKAAQRIGVTDARRRQPAVNQPSHSVPENPAILAAARQRAVPEPAYGEPKTAECFGVHWDPVVTDVSRAHRAQPLAHFRDGVVHASLELGFHLAQLGLQPLTNRLPQHREAPIASLLSADVRKAEEVERLGLPLTALLSVLHRERAELQQASLFGMQLQSELPQPF